MRTISRRMKNTLPARFAVLSLACLSLVSTGCGTGNVTPMPTAEPPTATPLALETSTASLPTNTPEVQPSPTTTAQSQSNQWKRVGGNEDLIQDLAIAPQNSGSTLAAGIGSIWLSAPNDYETWRQLSVPVTGNIASAAMGSEYVMYVTGNTGCASGLPTSLQRSSDGGGTWQEVSSPAAPLHIAAVDETVAYGTSCGGVVRSTDSGATWSMLPGAGMENYDPQRVVASSDGQTLYVSYVSEGGTVRIQRSTDSGSSWLDVTQKGNPENQRAFISNMTYVPGPDSSSGLYVTKGHELWHLPPGGDDWVLVTSLEDHLNFTALVLDLTEKGKLAAIFAAKASSVDPELNGYGVSRSRDGGTTWEPVGDELNKLSVSDLVLTASGVLLASTNAGIWAIQAR